MGRYRFSKQIHPEKIIMFSKMEDWLYIKEIHILSPG